MKISFQTMENRVNSPKKKNILDRIANQLENITADINNKTDLTELKKKLKALVFKIYQNKESQDKLSTISTNSY